MRTQRVVLITAIVSTLIVSACGGSAESASTAADPLDQPAASSPAPAESAGGDVTVDAAFTEVCAALRSAMTVSAGEFMRDPGRSQVTKVSDLVKSDPAAQPLVDVVKDMQELGTWLKGKYDYDVAELVTFYVAQGMDAGKALKEATKMAAPLSDSALSQYLTSVTAIHGSPPVSLTSIQTDLDVACP